jgi:AcrR family transcriptional regulator
LIVRSNPGTHRRSHYLETVLELFIERGYHGVMMDTIVAVAGGSKATIYRYFESTQALFSAIVDELQMTLGAASAAEDVADLPLVDGLRTLARATARGALSERAIVLLRVAAGEYNRFPELAHLLFELAPGRSYERFAGFLQAKERRGEVVVDDLRIASEQFLAGIVGHLQGLTPVDDQMLTAKGRERPGGKVVSGARAGGGTDERTHGFTRG